MRNQKVGRLEQAIMYLKYAKYQIKLALDESDAYQASADQIDDLIADLDADIVFLQDGVPRVGDDKADGSVAGHVVTVNALKNAH